MKRTQIYLTPFEAQGVARVAAATGRTQSDVIREAIDDYLKRLGPQDRLGRLRAAYGIWKGEPPFDLQELREELERF